ncbi:MAG: hypothetical protein ACE5G0_05860 [Rhodothermales bacterium]
MQSQASLRPAAPLSPLPFLFARYVAGQIKDPFWDQFMQVLDANDTPPAERLALAAFLNDAFFDLGPDTVSMPKSEEVRDLLAAVLTPPSGTH